MKAAPPRPDRRADVSPRVLVGVLSVTAGSPTVYVRPAPNDRSPSLATQALEPPSSAAGRASATGKQRSTVVVVNELAVGVRMVWVDFEGEYQNVFATVPPGGRHALRTYVGHVWRVERDGDVATAPTCTGNTPLLLLPPPFAGTVWFTPRLILPSDPTALASLVPRGRGARTMFDRRTAAFGQVDAAWIFDAAFGSTGPTVEVQVNPEFSEAQAAAEADVYCTAIGRLPGFLLRDVSTVWIHRGDHGFGGGNDNLLIHTDRGEAYQRDAVLEEALVHEATHTSLDAELLQSLGWRAAMAADGGAISEYARNNPDQEDLAESMGPYLASSERHGRTDRVDPAAVATARRCIPHRIQFLDTLCAARGWSMAVKD